MSNLENIVSPNSLFVTGDKMPIRVNTNKSLEFDQSFGGYKPTVPVSEQIKQFIEEEFSKLRK
jgi:hypothetical protein